MYEESVPGKDIWSYNCNICDIGFAYRGDYQKHMKIHRELGHGQKTLAESLSPREKKAIPRGYVKYGFRIKNMEEKENGK